MYMNDEKISKKLFVENELQMMLRRATGGYVSRCEYDAHGETELVHVTLEVARRNTLTFDVDVTADSRWAIAKDVMRAVAERFE